MLAKYRVLLSLFFFFQAEDGIRDYKVTGVQTCALPISPDVRARKDHGPRSDGGSGLDHDWQRSRAVGAVSFEWVEIVVHDLGERLDEIGRASCRERV